MKHSFLFLSLFIILFSSSATQLPTKVLFIGNSFIFSNDLPNTFRQLAGAGGHRVEVGVAAKGGWSLADHVKSQETLDMLKSTDWDFVILQEQSHIPVLKQLREEKMYPAARTLVSEIRKTEATPLFFVTWGYGYVWPKWHRLGYKIMQRQIDEGYRIIAEELEAPLAPIGSAWRSAVSEHPELDLWQKDGSHPNIQGTYLSACVFYAVIFHESPEGLTYSADVSEDVAKLLQAAAAEAVFSE